VQLGDRFGHRFHLPGDLGDGVRDRLAVAGVLVRAVAFDQQHDAKGLGSGLAKGHSGRGGCDRVEDFAQGVPEGASRFRQGERQRLPIGGNQDCGGIGRRDVGAVCVDGTKVLANASKHAAVSYQKVGEQVAQLELEVKGPLALAEQTDTPGEASGLNVPQELARRETRLAAIKARAQGQSVPEPKAQYDFTNPESRIMKAGNGPHFEQAYKAQAAVDGEMWCSNGCWRA